MRFRASTGAIQMRARRPLHNGASILLPTSGSAMRAGRPLHNGSTSGVGSTVHNGVSANCSAGVPPASGSWSRAGRRDFNRRQLVLSLAILLLSATIVLASPPLATIKLDDTSPPVEIVRCHFDEGRIVIRHADNLHVLHAGDELDGTGVQLIEITPVNATLTITQTTPTPGLRIVKLGRSDSGAIRIREFATDPAALTSGSAEFAPQASRGTVATGKPKSDPGGD